MRLIPVVAAGLIIIGVASSIGRGLYPGSLGSRLEPGRSAILHAVGLSDPLAGQRQATVERFDQRFGNHRTATYLHIVLGSLFLVIAPLQFSARLRNRHRVLHRRTGRVLVGVGLIATLSGLFFGVVMPIAGHAERLVVTLVGTAVMVALIRAVVLIRRGNVAGHCAWMVRAFALMIGISTVRLVAGVLDLALTPLAYSSETIFVMSLWGGWGLTLAAAELWLRVQPLAAPPLVSPGGAV